MRHEAATYFVKTARVAVTPLSRGNITAMRQRGLGLAAMEQQGRSAKLTNYPNLPVSRTVKVPGADTPKIPKLVKTANVGLATKLTKMKGAVPPVTMKAPKLKAPKVPHHITTPSAQKINLSPQGLK
jgi:hypothetical protein